MEGAGGVLVVRSQTNDCEGGPDAHQNLFHTLQLGRRLKRLILEIGVTRESLLGYPEALLSLQESRALVKTRLRCTPTCSLGFEPRKG